MLKPAEPRIDWGRLLVVSLFGFLLALNISALATVTRGRHGVDAVVGASATTLTIIFYAIVLLSYVRRGRAVVTTSSRPAWVASVVATGLPLLLPLVGGVGGTSMQTDVVASLLIVAGLAWSVWALRTLGTNLSVVAQVRGLAQSGPYRWVRHPLYVGELVTVLGIALRSPQPAVIGLFVVLVGLQVFRAITEERLLAGWHPGYTAYCCGTARFVPGVF